MIENDMSEIGYINIHRPSHVAVLWEGPGCLARPREEGRHAVVVRSPRLCPLLRIRSRKGHCSGFAPEKGAHTHNWRAPPCLLNSTPSTADGATGGTLGATRCLGYRSRLRQ